MWLDDLDDGPRLIVRTLIGALIGAVCGVLPLMIGLIRGHRSMAWTGFGFSIFLGVFCPFVAVIPAIIFTIIVAVTEPIEKKKRKFRRPGSARRQRLDRADDFLEDGNPEVRRRRRREEEDDRPRRRRQHEDDDD